MNINSIKDKMNELLDKAYKAGYNDGINFSEEAHVCAVDYKLDEDDSINCIRNPEEPERSCTNCDHLYHSDNGYSFCDYINCEMDRKFWEPKQKHIEEHDCSTCGHSDGTFESLKNYCKFCAHGSCWIPKTNEKTTTNDDEPDNAINIGDEIEFEGHVGVVIRVHKYIGKDTYNVLSDNGHYWSGVLWLINETTAKKTGRHFDQVAELYKKMKED